VLWRKSASASTPSPVWYWDHYSGFSTEQPIIEPAASEVSWHSRRMSCLYCALPDLLEASTPLDPEPVDLIGLGFLEGQINGRTADLGYV